MRFGLALALASVFLFCASPALAKMKLNGITISGKLSVPTLFKLGAEALTAHHGAHAIKTAIAKPTPKPSPTAAAK